MMWSATWSPTVEQLASGMLNKTQRLTIEVEQNQKINKDIEQRYYAVEDVSEKFRCLLNLFLQQTIPAGNKVIVFTNHKETTEKIAEDLLTGLQIKDAGIIQPLHGGMRQTKRDAIMKKFRTGEIRVLVATDVAARGLDVPDIEHVVNFDLPSETDRYVHRIGRTGRAGKKGIAHTIFTSSDGWQATELLTMLEREGARIPPEVVAVVGRGRFHASRDSKQQRTFARFSSRSPTSMTTATDVDDWRRSESARGTPSPLRQRDAAGADGDGRHRGGSSTFAGRRRPLRTFTLKRDTGGDN
jgi:superfamily II DNA/RNA helicase